ncbi:MAG: lipopolysaccharide biosynthesis protein [Eubacteriales bacterium]|nr:lipopolysaccharide biosynthesis protein [Eubacteriales bacterium]
MKKLWERLKKNKYIGALALLLSGSALAQLFTFAAQPLMTRIFTETEIGIFSYLYAIPTIFVGVICARFDLAIVTEPDEDKVLSVVKLSALVTAGLSLLVTIGSAVYVAVAAPQYAGYWYLIPFTLVMMLAYGANNILNSYNNRYKEYKLITGMYVLRTLVQNVVMIALGFLLVSLLGLRDLSVLLMYAPYAVGLLAGVTRQARSLRPHWQTLRAMPFSEVKAAAARHRKQALLSSPAFLANSFSYSLITILMEPFFGEAAVGYYSMSSRVLGLPIALVSNNVARVFIEQASKEHAETGRFRRAFLRNFAFLAALAVPLFLAMFFLAPPLCEWFFGSGWHVAGEYIRILAPMLTMRFVATAISQGLIVGGKQSWELAVQLMLVAAVGASGVMTWTTGGSVEYFLAWTAWLRSAVYVFQILLVFICSRMKTEEKKND